MKCNKLFEADLAEMTAMYASAYAEKLTQHIEDLMIEKDKNRDSIVNCIQHFEHLMLNIDMLLEDHPTLRLERWLNYPHLHDNGDPERGERFEHNARRIVTIWGPPVDDYSARIWSGLIRDYYLPRWMFYFDAKLNDKPIDFAEWERQWVEEKTGVSAIEKNDDVIGLCKETVSYCKNLCDARNRKDI